MMRSGELRIRQTREDTLLPGRTHERANQYYRGVRVFGGDIARQLRNGVTESLFGTIYEGIEHRCVARCSTRIAHGHCLAARTGQPIADRWPAELIVLPLDAGGYRADLAPCGSRRRGDARQYFVDAQHRERRSSTSAIGSDRAPWGAPPACSAIRKKISVHAELGTVSGDRRPAAAGHRDLRHAAAIPTRARRLPERPHRPRRRATLGQRLRQRLDGRRRSCDAHIYAGYTYDYYFKRFGRRGLDNANIRIQSSCTRCDAPDARRRYPDVTTRTSS